MSRWSEVDTLPRAAPRIAPGPRVRPPDAAASRPRPARSRPRGTRAGPPILARPRGGAAPGARRTRRPKVRRRRRVRPRLRLPLPPRWPAWLWFAVLLTATLTLAFSPALRVQRIEVRGLRWTDPARLTALPAVAAWRGQPLVAVDPVQAAAVLRAAFPALEEVTVQVRWPDTLRIEARERQPALVWQVGRQTWWVDATGAAFPALGEADPAWPVVEVQVPAAQGPPDPPTADEVALAQALHQRLGPEVGLVYHPQYGLGWRAPQAWLVFVGHSPQDLDVRLAVYDALVPALEARGLYPAWVDLRIWQSPGLHFKSQAR